MTTHCGTCKHRSLSPEIEPCRSCYYNEYIVGDPINWEPACPNCAALQAELDKAKDAERWIPVSERLPERNTEILFWVRPNKIGFMVFGQLVDNKYNHDVWMAIAQSASKNYKYPAVEDTYSADEVTHWKYRAAPPKEDE